MQRTTSIPSVISILLILTAATAQAQNVTADQMERMREQERAENLVARWIPTAAPGGALNGGGAWWRNDATAAELGLTDDQKSRIGRVFEIHSQAIVRNAAELEREELQLARLLEAESIDQTAIANQTNRVIQARGEVERATAAMTLEMRQQLTRAQWVKLQTLAPAGLSGRGGRGGGRGGRGGGGGQ